MRRAPAVDGRCTIVGPGSRMEGTLHVDHAVHVEGVLHGQLHTPGCLVVGDAGEVVAETVEVGEAQIFGRLTGALKASHSVHLGAGSCLRGRVETPRLVVEEGARLLDESGDLSAAAPAAATPA